MTEASRVQKLLIEQNAEIDRLKNRIEELKTALQKIIDRAEFRHSEYVTDIVCRIAREALEKKDE